MGIGHVDGTPFGTYPRTWARARRSRAVPAVLLMLAAALAASCAPATSPQPGTTLAGVEVRDHRGQRLDSVGDFRENSIAGPQHIDISKYRLHVGGSVSVPATYTYDQVLSQEATYTKVVRLDCVEGWSVRILWEGVLLSDLIDRARPASDAVTVVFRAADGYATSLPLDYIRSQHILLAYRMNGITIPEERGFPFMVVAQDRWGYKWAKWVTRIELSTDPGFLGYWEQRGYSQTGIRSESRFSR